MTEPATLPQDEPVTLEGFQSLIKSMFGAKDASRGTDGTFMWFMEEVGELAGALRKGPKDDLALEFADVLAWLVTLANIAEVDLDDAVRRKYGGGCPRCRRDVCECGPAKKP
ncbi:MAG: nucleotide pyrophosphohydrolase [Planctomycetota bacterium]|nr:nucleotide pyrophosphohydrolase [Planctomycetaceae bacterium]MDQ3333289.1 nucleotide pyrophosphohydrolase [Planctomycetota bacterium]